MLNARPVKSKVVTIAANDDAALANRVGQVFPIRYRRMSNFGSGDDVNVPPAEAIRDGRRDMLVKIEAKRCGQTSGS
jgi:hypothetical protein